MPRMNIPDKICRKCGSTDWFFRFDRLKNSTVYGCVPCKYKADKSWRQSNPEATKAICKRTRDKVRHTEEYKHKNVQRAMLWNKNNFERHKEHHKKTRDNYVKNLSDYYVKSMIVNSSDGIDYSDISLDMIEIKRKHALLRRQIKNHANSRNT
jgi:hypothetical protein